MRSRPVTPHEDNAVNGVGWFGRLDVFALESFVKIAYIIEYKSFQENRLLNRSLHTTAP